MGSVIEVIFTALTLPFTVVFELLGTALTMPIEALVTALTSIIPEPK